ncbi:MAG: DUF3152 domain-containing protein [Nocardioides sp.]
MRSRPTCLVLLLGVLVAALAPRDAGAAEPGRPELELVAAPTIAGDQRYGETVEVVDARWDPAPRTVRYQWLRAGEPIAGATKRRYTIAPGDVGSRLRVQVTAYERGYEPTTATSDGGDPVRHAVPVRRTVTYSVETRGRITADLDQFRRVAQATYDDARGWRGGGVRFVPVRRGGSFTLVLAEARTVPTFSSQCSAEYSCRVGRFVIINQTRWLRATRVWRGAGQTRADYRHLVVNHETGHWLGRGHVGCPGRGQLAPVMMQQSKGLNGCRANPWPTAMELR